ncbi:uncharacterized protein HKW66_Vig0111750 [Vigna angularis]|uniref:Uncharacterized protein n=1 Tax=Phaseolus angularis TaxID=3914 RepID=A0A8T0L1D2_PHAAN|nr:uncharacterized protein HKW66_Vig0111750 [Vigna angularis]
MATFQPLEPPTASFRNSTYVGSMSRVIFMLLSPLPSSNGKGWILIRIEALEIYVMRFIELMMISGLLCNNHIH